MNQYKIQLVTETKQSALTKYCTMIIGRSGVISFVSYEAIMMFVAPCPGALGIILRKIFFPFLMKKVGKGVVFGRNITLRHPAKIEIGNNVVIDDNCMLDAKGSDNHGIVIGDNVFLGRNSILSCKNGDILLRENVNIGFNCEVYSSNTVEIGKDTLLAAYTYIIGGGEYDTSVSDVSMSGRPLFDKTKKIKIGNDCWLGAGVKVLNDVLIGDGAVIGSGAVVNKNIAPRSIAVGIPAKVVKVRE